MYIHAENVMSHENHENLRGKKVLFYVPAKIVVEADGPHQFYLDKGFRQGEVIDTPVGSAGWDENNGQKDIIQSKAGHRYCLVQVQLQCRSKEPEIPV